MKTTCFVTFKHDYSHLYKQNEFALKDFLPSPASFIKIDVFLLKTDISSILQSSWDMLEAKLSEFSSFLKMCPQVFFKRPLTFRLCSQTTELGRRTTGPKTAGGEVQRRRWRRADKVILVLVI